MSLTVAIIELVLAYWIILPIISYLFGRYLYHKHTIHFFIFALTVLVVLLIIQSIIAPGTLLTPTVSWPMEFLFMGVSFPLIIISMGIGIKHWKKAECLRDGGKWDNEKGSCKIEE